MLQRKNAYQDQNISILNFTTLNVKAKLITIEQLNQLNLDKSTLRKRLKVRENFWILTLETLHPKGLNRELNKI